MKHLRMVIMIAALLAAFAISVISVPSASAHTAMSTNVQIKSVSHATTCGNYDFWRGAAAGWYHENSGGQLCWNGSQIWQSGGSPSCSMIVYPPYTANITWCGIYNSGGSYVDVGMNANWSILWGGNWPCYMRVRVNNNGSVVSASATC